MTTPEPPVTPAKPRRSRAPQADPEAPVPPVETAEVAGVSAQTPPPLTAAGDVPPTMTPPDDVVADREPAAPDGARRTKTVHLPYVTAIVEVPNVPRPRLPHVGRREVTEAAGAVTSLLPSPSRLLFYGGLGALAALEVIEWPVAAVVAAATFVAGRGGERDRGVLLRDRAPRREPALT